MTTRLLYSPDEAAELIGLAAKTVARWSYGAQPAPAGFPPPVRVGRLLRYRHVDIEKWVAALPPARGEASSTEALPLPPPPAAKRGRGRPRKTQASK